MGVGFEEISIFLKERAYGQVGILGHAAVVAFAAAAFTGEHGAGALDVLMELQVLVDGKGVGHRLHVEIVGADECKSSELVRYYEKVINVFIGYTGLNNGLWPAEF